MEPWLTLKEFAFSARGRWTSRELGEYSLERVWKNRLLDNREKTRTTESAIPEGGYALRGGELLTWCILLTLLVLVILHILKQDFHDPLGSFSIP